jgi:hypothetical protein
MLSDFDNHGHRSVKDLFSEAHNSMAFRIYDLTKERHMRELFFYRMSFLSYEELLK